MSLTSPFQMVGDPAAAACVGDVCEIPQAAAAPTAPEDTDTNPLLSEHARVIRQLDENRV